MEQSEQKANLVKIDRAIEALLPTNVYYCCVDNFDSKSLLPQDVSYLSKIKSPIRSKQYALGRTAARKALSNINGLQADANSLALVKLESGLVNWPSSIVGSISHSEDIAVAIVASNAFYRMLGVDLEFFREVSEATASRIAQPEELEILSKIGKSEQQKFFAIFSAKESIFKAIYPLTNTKFSFNAVQLNSFQTILAKDENESVHNLKFTLVQELSADFPLGSTIIVKLYNSDYFSLTLCAIPSVSY